MAANVLRNLSVLTLPGHDDPFVFCLRATTAIYYGMTEVFS